MEVAVEYGMESRKFARKRQGNTHEWTVFARIIKPLPIYDLFIKKVKQNNRLQKQNKTKQNKTKQNKTESDHVQPDDSKSMQPSKTNKNNSNNKKLKKTNKPNNFKKSCTNCFQPNPLTKPIGHVDITI